MDGRRLRQRFDASGSSRYGVDLLGEIELSSHWRAKLHGALLHAHDSSETTFRRLPQRPAYELGGSLEFQPHERISLRGKFRRVGPAFDLDSDGEWARLPGRSFRIGLQLD